MRKTSEDKQTVDVLSAMSDSRTAFLVLQVIFDETQFHLLMQGRADVQARADDLSILASHGRFLSGRGGPSSDGLPPHLAVTGFILQLTSATHHHTFTVVHVGLFALRPRALS